MVTEPFLVAVFAPPVRIVLDPEPLTPTVCLSNPGAKEHPSVFNQKSTIDSRMGYPVSQEIVRDPVINKTIAMLRSAALVYWIMSLCTMLFAFLIFWRTRLIPGIDRMLDVCCIGCFVGMLPPSKNQQRSSGYHPVVLLIDNLRYRDGCDMV